VALGPPDTHNQQKSSRYVQYTNHGATMVLLQPGEKSTAAAANSSTTATAQYDVSY